MLQWKSRDKVWPMFRANWRGSSFCSNNEWTCDESSLRWRKATCAASWLAGARLRPGCGRLRARWMLWRGPHPPQSKMSFFLETNKLFGGAWAVSLAKNTSSTRFAGSDVYSFHSLSTNHGLLFNASPRWLLCEFQRWNLLPPLVDFSSPSQRVRLRDESQST